MNFRACGGCGLGLLVSAALAACVESDHVLGDVGVAGQGGEPQTVTTGGTPNGTSAAGSAGAPTATGGSSQNSDGASGQAGGKNARDAATGARPSHDGGSGGSAGSDGGVHQPPPADGGAAGGPATPPAFCKTTLENIDPDVCSYEDVCSQVGCGTISAEMDQCGNPRKDCDSNADCQSNEVCVPIEAYGGALGCGADCFGQPGDCFCEVNTCFAWGPHCTVAEGLPAPCTQDPEPIIFASMVGTLAVELPSAIPPEIRRPLLLCVERFHDAHTGDESFCFDMCKDEECTDWCRADPERSYDALISAIVDGGDDLEVTPLASAMTAPDTLEQTLTVSGPPPSGE
jgi:hypothetical protein